MVEGNATFVELSLITSLLTQGMALAARNFMSTTPWGAARQSTSFIPIHARDKPTKIGYAIADSATSESATDADPHVLQCSSTAESSHELTSAVDVLVEGTCLCPIQWTGEQHHLSRTYFGGGARQLSE